MHWMPASEGVYAVGVRNRKLREAGTSAAAVRAHAARCLCAARPALPWLSLAATSTLHARFMNDRHDDAPPAALLASDDPSARERGLEMLERIDDCTVAAGAVSSLAALLAKPAADVPPREWSRIALCLSRLISL
eukprot:COSAG02_NODE_33231_length_503_cov_1.022277_1_plen_134_part_10